MAHIEIGPAHDQDTIHQKDLEAELLGKQRWTLAWCDAVIKETEKAILFRDNDENGYQRNFWVPKACCERVMYVSNVRTSGAFKFPMKFARKRRV